MLRRRRPATVRHSAITVYDNIFDADRCTLLHELAVDHCNRCDRGSIFLRTPDQKHRLTPLEKAVDTILNALNDTSTIVEYWSRSRYINIDAHADIDEDTLKHDGVLRCPKNAHVLYLQIANSGKEVGESDDDRSRRMGPTVVFPERRVAWGGVTAIPSVSGGEEYVVDVEDYWEEDTKQEHDLTSSGERNEEMAIVPAKTGRLLRFDGRAFHAVPKPPHRYVMTKKELNKYLKAEDENCDDDDEYWDDEYDDFEEEETDLENLRSVLLFNTWSHSGPKGVLPDSIDIEDGLPEDIELYSPSFFDYQTQMEEKRQQDWQEDYGRNFEKVWCNRIDDWKHVPVNGVNSTSTKNIVTVPLMGNPSRKGCAIEQDEFCSSTIDLKTNFYYSEQVSLLDLEEV